MKYHLVTWDHVHTIGLTSQRDAMALVQLLSKGVKMRRDYTRRDREVWSKEPIEEVSIKSIDLKDAPPEKSLRTARGRALPAPPAALQLGFSASETYDPYADEA